MEHAFVDEHDLVVRYVAGRLSPDEIRDFEAHFVDCPACLERIGLEQAFRAGLIEAAGRSPIARVDTRAVGTRRIVARAFAAAALIVLAAGITIAYVQVRRQRDAALLRTATLERDYAQTRARADALESRLHGPGSAPLRVAVVELDTVRAGGRPTYVPSVTIPPSTSLVVFNLAVGNAADYSRFAASIETSHGAVLVRVADLRQASSTSVALAIDASNLSSGDYTIVLEGVIRNRPSSVIARYSVHLIRG